MKITAISYQVRNPNRVNVSVDGKYSFSLDIAQLADLGLKTDREYSETEIQDFKQESEFGKVYSRTLEYCLSRPHSAKEIRDYLYKKTFNRRDKTGKSIDGISKLLTERVFEKLVAKGYINDKKFALFWVENRMQKRGISRRQLISELAKKGISKETISETFTRSDRGDKIEIQKIIEKKRSKYSDNQKFMSYLARQGFSYDDIREALDELDD